MHACYHPRPVCNSCMPDSSLLSPSSATAVAAAYISAPWRTHITTQQASPTFSVLPLHRRSLRTSCCASLQQRDIPASSTSTASSTALPSPGHIELVIGPMFAGKSSELLRRVSHYESEGLNVAIVKSNKDDRYSSSHVVTHDGIKKQCHAVPTLTSFRETMTAVYTDADVIAIDEAQFFTDLKEFCTFAADHHQKRLILAGLDGDFLRRKFGQVLDLVPLADKVTKLTATCRFCQQEEEQKNGNNSDNTSNSGDGGKYPAVFSLRISAESGNEQELVGGSDTYAPVCRKHYVQFAKVEK